MGRKGVSKQKKVKVKAAPVSGSNSASSERKPFNQPERVMEKGKASPKGNRKH